MRRYLPFVGLFLVLSGPLSAVDLSWQSVATDHFTFIYRSAHQTTVNELVTFAEEVYEELTSFIGSSPRKIDVVIFGESDLANGYYSPAPPQHIGLYISEPTLPWTGAQTGSWLRLLFVHELTHYVHANPDRGPFSLAGTLFGRSLTGLSLAFTPLWTIEGLAVNTETMFTDGGRGRDPFFEMTYKAPVVENRLFSLNQAGYDSHLAPTGRHYVAGFFIWEYMMEQYGEDVVEEVLGRYARFPFFGVWGPIRRTTGTRMRDIYSAIAADLERTYSGVAGRTPARRITPLVRSDYYLPTETARGLYLYRTRPDRRPAIVEFDPDTGTERIVLETRLSDSASWSVTTDGRTIAFATVEFDRNFPDEDGVYSDIYLHDRTDGSVRRLTTGGGYHQPAIAPDGAYLVAVERIAGGHRLVRFDLSDGAAGHRPVVVLAGSSMRLYTPTISPDGRRIAVMMNQRGVQQLALVDAQRGVLEFAPQIDGGTSYFPAFDGNDALLLGNDRDGGLRVYRLSLERGSAELVADDPVGAYAARSVGDAILVATYTADGYALRMQPSGTIGPGDARVPVVDATPLRTIALAPPVAGTRYAVRPQPRYWLPLLGLAGPGIDLAGLGAGALVFGSDLLQRTTWQVSGVYYPVPRQTDYSLLWATQYGAWGARLASDSYYRAVSVAEDDTEHARVFRQAATVAWRPLSRYLLGTSENVVSRLGVTHSLTFASASQFSFGELGRADVALETNRLRIAADVSASRVPLSSRRAYHPPWARSIALSLASPLDAPEFRPAALVATAAGSVNLGLGSSDHVIALRPTVNYSTSLGFAEPLHLRGFSELTNHDASSGMRGRYRLALDYRTPHLLVDLPLLPGVGITGFGFTLFAEATGGYDPAPFEFAVDEAVAIGAEVTTLITYWLPIPVTAGVALRLRPAGIGPPAREDLKLYLQSDLLGSIPTVPQYLDRER